MKAKEYYEKYKPLLTAEAVDTTGFSQMTDQQKQAVLEVIDHQVKEGIKKCLYDMSMEVRSLIEQRGAKTDSAAASIIREMNDRWNAMLRLIEKDGKPVLVKENAVARYWISQIPSLKKHIHIPKDEEEVEEDVGQH